MTTKRPQPQPFTLFFDGDCPLCKREIAWISKKTNPSEVKYIDIASESFDAAMYGATKEEMMAEIHALDEQGKLIQGMDVFRKLYAYAGLAWLMAPTKIPVLRSLFDAAYSLFARYRLSITGRRDCISCQSYVADKKAE